MSALDRLCNAFLDAHPEGAARALEKLPPADIARVIGESRPASGAEVLQRLDPHLAAGCVAALDPDHASAVIRELPLDCAVLILRQLAEEAREGLLARIKRAVADPIRVQLRFPEGTAGALTDATALVFHDDITVEEALALVRSSARPVEHAVFVVNRERRLRGVVSVPRLLRTDPAAEVASLLREDVVPVSAHTPLQEVVHNPAWQGRRSLPVVEGTDLLVGVLNYETVFRAAPVVADEVAASGALSTVSSLGELYWLGLSGMLTGLASGTTAAGREAQPEEKPSSGGSGHGKQRRS